MSTKGSIHAGTSRLKFGNTRRETVQKMYSVPNPEKRVLIIEAQIKRYRRPLYDLLYDALRAEGIRLRVVYSSPSIAEIRKDDNCELPSHYGVRVAGYWFARGRLLFQPAFREIAAADLVVIDQANKFIVNHLLLPLALFNLKKVAFWGLGENLQADRSVCSEWYKRLTLTWVQAWFAYTEGTAGYLLERKVPHAKITAVQNSVDTRGAQACIRNFTGAEKASLRASLGIAPTESVGIYVGMLHKVKSIPFLIEAGEKVRQSIPGFRLLIAGGGPDEDELRRSVSSLPWVHFVGPKFGDDKSHLLAIADLFLLPGRAGLAVLDAFAASLPLVVTQLFNHGPEIEYVVDGFNGLITRPDSDAYARAIVTLLSNPDQLRSLRDGAAISAEKYSIEAMVDRFKRGLIRCLETPKWQRSQLKWRSEENASQGYDS